MKFEYKIKGITLSMTDMTEINQYYKIASTAEYLLENYDSVDETNVMNIASEVRRYMDKYDLLEGDAITAVLNI